MVALCRSNIPDFYYFNNHFCKMGEFIGACIGYFMLDFKHFSRRRRQRKEQAESEKVQHFDLTVI